MKSDSWQPESLHVLFSDRASVEWSSGSGMELGEWNGAREVEWSKGSGMELGEGNGARAVSYTHLTLPTICSV